MIRALYTGDLHVEPGDAIGAAALRRVVDIARASRVSLWFITGDAAGHVVPYRPPWVVVTALQAMTRDLSDIAPGAWLAGNHDIGGAIEAIAGAEGLHPVHVVLGCERLTMFTRDGVADVHGVAYPRRGHGIGLARDASAHAVQVASDALDTLLRSHGATLAAEPDRPDACFGVGHWMVRGSRAEHGEIVSTREPVASVDAFDAWGVDWGCMGHLHMPQRIGTRGAYGGSLFATDRADRGDKWVHVVDVGEPDDRPDPPGTLWLDLPDDGRRRRVRVWRCPTGSPPVATVIARWGEVDGGIGWIERPTPEEVAALWGHVVHVEITRQTHAAASCPIDGFLAELTAAEPAKLIAPPPRSEVVHRDRPEVPGESSPEPGDRMAAYFNVRADDVPQSKRDRAAALLDDLIGGGVADVIGETERISAGDTAPEVTDAG